MDQRQRFRVIRIGEGLSDGDLRDAGDGDDVAGARGLGRDALQGLGDQQLGEFHVLDAAVVAAPRNLLAAFQLTRHHPAQRQPAQVGGGVQVRHVRLEGGALLVGGGGHVLQDRLEQRFQVRRVRHLGVGGLVQGCAPRLRGGVDDREVQRVGGVVVEQVHEQVVGLVHHRGDPGVGTIHLVDHDDQRQLLRQGLAQHEPGLRQRPLGGVDQQHHAVDHLQAPLHLTAEVGVTGGVDDVDGHLPAVGHPVPHGGVLRQDRDALLAFQIHGVHDPLVDVGALPEGTRLPQHGVDERRLPVVDVGDDRNVAQVVTDGHAGS